MKRGTDYSDKWALFVLLNLVGCLALSIFALPLTYRVEGRVTDWIGNDNGFGLAIDGEIYFLSYGGFVNGSIPFGPNMKGSLVRLVYVGSPIFPRGAVPFYARTVSLTIFGAGGGNL